MSFYWEEVNCWEFTYRAKVHGGWILRYQTLFDNRIHSGEEIISDLVGWDNIENKLIFIPDPKHEWSIE